MNDPTRRPDADLNPYASPLASESPAAIAAESDAESLITANTVALMRQIRPWVFVFSVLAFLAAAWSVAMACFTIVMGHGAAKIEGFVSIALVLPTYVLPAVLLWRYGQRIGDFLRVPDLSRLDLALRAQRTFWRTVGILALILLLLVFAAVLIGFAAAMMSVSAR